MTDSLSFDQLAKLFHMPLSDAAKEIGICCTALKKACRKNNITRWPHRKVKSLDRMIEGLEAKANEAPNSEEADKVMIELEYYKNQRGLIMKNTGSHRLTDQALKMKPCSAISKSSSSSLGSGSSSSSSSSFYGTGAAASSPLSSSVSSPSNVLGFGLSHHGLAASSSSSSSGSPSSGTDSSSSPEMYQPSPADSELFDNLIFASEFNQQQQQQNQLQFQQQQMAQHYQDLFQQQLAIMQMPEFCTPAASSASASQQQTSPTTAGPFFPKPAGPSFSAQQQQQQQQQVVSPQNLFYFQQPMMDGKNGAFMNPQFMYNFSPNAMPFMPNPMSAFMFPFGYPFPSFPMASTQSPVDLSVQTNQNQLRSFPSSSSSAALPALSTPEPSYSAESPSFFRNSDALDALFVKQEGNFDSSLPEYAQAF